MDKRYIDEMVRIRKEYLILSKTLSNYNIQKGDIKSQQENNNDNIVNKLLINISDTYSVINEHIDNIDKELMDDKIEEMKKTVRKIEEEIKNTKYKISKLEDQSDKLYDKIKEKYPNMTQDEMITIVKPYIEKVDISYKN
jgi:chromosome segregation ATPase